jgi:thioesterase domain-containing protein
MSQIAPPSDSDYSPNRLFKGRLTLFRGRAQPEGLAIDHDMGWGGLASNLIVHEIEGHHTDAYKEPSISQWIAVLRETLGEADSQGDGLKLPQQAGD